MISGYRGFTTVSSQGKGKQAHKRMVRGEKRREDACTIKAF